ncbi:MAG: hypothetical protein ACI8P9_000053 [Parasphingorhabdus sp.]|jgi:uncharacterized protein YqgV (UPF0045/DUF77 family)
MNVMMDFCVVPLGVGISDRQQSMADKISSVEQKLSQEP